MSSYATTDRADFDLIEIYVDGVELFGQLQAVNYAREMEAVFEPLADYLRMGRLAGDVGVRRHEHGSHVILYRETQDGVTVLAVVLSASMRRLRL